MSITADIQGLEPGALIELFEVDCTAIGGDMLRFHGHLQSTSIFWQGNEYKPWSIQGSGFEHTSDAQQPEPTLTVGNVNGTISALCVFLADMVGARVTRHRTLSKYLDAANFPRNNFLLWSEAFEQDSWQLINSVASKVATLDPNGNQEGRRISRVTAGNNYIVQYVPNIQSSVGFNGSIYLRADETQDIGPLVLRLRDSNNVEYVNKAVRPVAGAWSRFDISAVFPPDAAPGVLFFVDPGSDGEAAGDSFLAYGAQLVSGLAVQPYVFTDAQTGYNPSADPGEEMAVELWYIEQKTSETNVQVEFTLSSALDFGGQQVPARQIASACQWKYRDANCGYTGSAYFTIKDVATDDPALDRCSMKISGCECRFGVNEPLPFGGFLSDNLS